MITLLLLIRYMANPWYGKMSCPIIKVHNKESLKIPIPLSKFCFLVNTIQSAGRFYINLSWHHTHRSFLYLCKGLPTKGKGSCLQFSVICTMRSEFCENGRLLFSRGEALDQLNQMYLNLYCIVENAIAKKEPPKMLMFFPLEFRDPVTGRQKHIGSGSMCSVSGRVLISCSSLFSV